jgi:hypothetical protein
VLVIDLHPSFDYDYDHEHEHEHEHEEETQSELASRHLLFTILYPRFPSRSGGEMADTYV